MKNSKLQKAPLSVIIFSTLSLLINCRAPIDSNPPFPTADQFKVLWKTPISYGPYSPILGINPQLYDSMVVVNSSDNIYNSESPLIFIDTASGEVIDIWSNFIDGTTWYTTDQFYRKGKFLIMQTRHSTDCINLATRQRQWASTTNVRQSAFIYGNNGFVYTCQYADEKTASVLRSPIDQNNWETFYSFTANGKMIPFFDGIGFGSLPNGDEIVLWQNRSTHPIDRMEVFAYNITADSLLWRNRDFPGGDIPFSPQVHNGKVYGRYVSSVYCLDLETGETLWLRNLNTALGSGPVAAKINYIGFYDNQLIVNADRPKIAYLNQEKGFINRVVDGYPSGYGEGDYSYYQGKLYYTSAAQLVITDITTGENLATPAKLGELNDIEIRSSVTIDPETGKLYFQDGYYLYCVKQPKVL